MLVTVHLDVSADALDKHEGRHAFLPLMVKKGALIVNRGVVDMARGTVHLHLVTLLQA
jgi:hypothetical protein